MRSHLSALVLRLWLCLALTLLGCDDSADTTGAAIKLPNAGSGGAGAGTGAGISGSSGMAGSAAGAMSQAGTAAPAETSTKTGFEPPQASERFVYAANPDRGKVVIVDADTLRVQAVETGDRPTVLRTIPGTDDAVVLDVGSDDATVIRSPGHAVATSTVPVVHGANTVALAPDGRHALAYFDPAASAQGDAPGSFQDVTVIALDDGGDSAFDLTVGFRPRTVFFAADGSAAYVMTDDGICVLDFATIDRGRTSLAPPISLGDDLDQKSLDVSVTPDGRYALARQPGRVVVRLLDLGSGEQKTLDMNVLPLPIPGAGDEDAGMPAAPALLLTDLDLAANGRFALAVVRSHSTVVRIPIPSGFDDPGEVRLYPVLDQVFGSATITPDAERALLYTTATEIERITVLDLTGNAPPSSIALRKSIAAVAVAPDSRTALIIHKKADGDSSEAGIDEDTRIDRSFGYSALRIGNGKVKLQVTPVAPGAFTSAPDGSALFVLIRDDMHAIRQVQSIASDSLLVQPIALGGAPTSLGTIPAAHLVFVSQQNPDGRLSLIDWRNGDTRTVTGLELNSQIHD